MENYKQQILNVFERIKTAAENSRRSLNNITLIAVSKNRSVSAIKMAYENNIRHFAESKPSELENKVIQLSDYKDIQWNFIGKLDLDQSEIIAKYCDIIHTIDTVEIAEALSRKLVEENRILKIYIQINILDGENNAGFNANDWENNKKQQDSLIEEISKIAKLPNMKIQGLMTIAPNGIPHEVARNIFQKTKKLSNWIKNIFPDQNFSSLSMGMSGDFELAIEEGATCVRVGSAIFDLD